MFLTTTVTFLLVAAIHTVGVGVTAPADGDAMAIFALELIAVALQITAILDQSTKNPSVSAPGVSNFKVECQISKGSSRAVPRLNHRHSRGPRRTSSARQCNGRLCRRTRSLSTDEALGTEKRQLSGAREDDRAETRGKEQGEA